MGVDTRRRCLPQVVQWPWGKKTAERWGLTSGYDRATIKKQMLRYNCFFIFAAGTFSPKVLGANAVKTKTKQLKTAESPEQEPLGAKKLGAAKKLPVLGR